ncbi:MAG: hypothetical protein ACE5K2_07805, partial [Candidatus Zixiibacteriota bacterium]
SFVFSVGSIGNVEIVFYYPLLHCPWGDNIGMNPEPFRFGMWRSRSRGGIYLHPHSSGDRYASPLCLIIWCSAL